MARNSLKSVCRLINAVNTEVPIQDQFVADLKRSIEITDNNNRRKPSQSYKPSSMNCIRNMYFQMTGAEFESDSNAVFVGICESGTDRHERTQNAVAQMRENGFDCDYVNVAEYVKSRELNYLDIIAQCGNETKLFHKDLKMSFLCDGIIRYKGKYYILEIKTESINKWYNRKGVDPKHYNQGIAYSEALKLDGVIFLYINRDMCDMKAFMFNVTQGMRDELVNKIKTCDNYVAKKQVPPKPVDLDRRNCNYCNYKKLCNQY